MTFNKLHNLISEKDTIIKFWRIEVHTNPLRRNNPPLITPQFQIRRSTQEAYIDMLEGGKNGWVTVDTNTYFLKKIGVCITFDLTLFSFFRFIIQEYNLEMIRTSMNNMYKSSNPLTTYAEQHKVYTQWLQFIKNINTGSIKSQGFDNTEDLDAL